MRVPLKILIYVTLGVSLIAALFPALQSLLALSWAGISRLYLWQLISYPFIQPGPVSFSFFLQLGINMYILWMFGATLIERCHPKLFFTLYFGATLASGLTMLAFPNSHLAGSTNPVYAILMAWMLLNPGAKLLLFFAMPFAAKWLILGLFAMTLFADVAAGLFVASATLAASLAFAYVFTLLAFRQQSPFAFLRPLERKLLRLLEKKKVQPYRSSKVYDIKSGAPVMSDDAFMDAMLDKISRHGEDALTPAEKKRMQSISERKNRPLA